MFWVALALIPITLYYYYFVCRSCRRTLSFTRTLEHAHTLCARNFPFPRDLHLKLRYMQHERNVVACLRHSVQSFITTCTRMQTREHCQHTFAHSTHTRDLEIYATASAGACQCVNRQTTSCLFVTVCHMRALLHYLRWRQSATYHLSTHSKDQPFIVSR